MWIFIRCVVSVTEIKMLKKNILFCESSTCYVGIHGVYGWLKCRKFPNRKVHEKENIREKRKKK